MTKPGTQKTGNTTEESSSGAPIPKAKRTARRRNPATAKKVVQAFRKQTGYPASAAIAQAPVQPPVLAGNGLQRDKPAKRSKTTSYSAARASKTRGPESTVPAPANFPDPMQYFLARAREDGDLSEEVLQLLEQQDAGALDHIAHTELQKERLRQKNIVLDKEKLKTAMEPVLTSQRGNIQEKAISSVRFIGRYCGIEYYMTPNGWIIEKGLPGPALFGNTYTPKITDLPSSHGADKALRDFHVQNLPRLAPIEQLPRVVPLNLLKGTVNDLKMSVKQEAVAKPGPIASNASLSTTYSRPPQTGTAPMAPPPPASESMKRSAATWGMRAKPGPYYQNSWDPSLNLFKDYYAWGDAAGMGVGGWGPGVRWSGQSFREYQNAIRCMQARIPQMNAFSYLEHFDFQGRSYDGINYGSSWGQGQNCIGQNQDEDISKFLKMDKLRLSAAVKIEHDCME